MAENDDSGDGGGENTKETKTEIEARNACNGKSGPIGQNTARNGEEEVTGYTPAATGTANGSITRSAENPGPIASPTDGGVERCDEGNNRLEFIIRNRYKEFCLFFLFNGLVVLFVCHWYYALHWQRVDKLVGWGSSK